MNSPKSINETNRQSCLEINGFVLPIFLGWPDAERKSEQTITLDIEIHFRTPPLACSTDKLEDTFCYSHLADILHEQIAHQAFHLIENATKVIYELIKSEVPCDATVIVHLRKFPNIDGLTKGVRFTYGDTAC